MASPQARRRLLALLVAAAAVAVAAAASSARSARSILVRGGGEQPARNRSSLRSRPGETPDVVCRQCVCGAGRRARIVNGELAGGAEFPWAAGLDYQGAHHCGASLITRRHLLTAAHCVQGFRRRHFSLRLADGARHPVASLRVHERYDRRSFDNDIAIVELQRPVALGDALRTVCLPGAAAFGDYEGASGVAVGWGRTGEGQPVSERLRKVELPIMSRQQCLRSDYPRDRLTDNMFCAGYLSGERDSCSGDSGGALHVRNERGAMEVVGLVSFGRGCARPNFPGVYTKVSNYLRWIGRHLDSECLCSSPDRL